MANCAKQAYILDLISNFNYPFDTCISHFFFRLVGDVLLATAFLSYSGPFNQEFRDILLNCWKKEMRKNKIPFSEVSLS